MKGPFSLKQSDLCRQENLITLSLASVAVFSLYVRLSLSLSLFISIRYVSDNPRMIVVYNFWYWHVLFLFDFCSEKLSVIMYLQFYINDNGDKVYTTKVNFVYGSVVYIYQRFNNGMRRFVLSCFFSPLDSIWNDLLKDCVVFLLCRRSRR